MPRNRQLLVGTLALVILSCTEDRLNEPGESGGVSSVDSTAPSAITGLVVKSATPKSLALVWSAPGDDGIKGKADAYDIRYAAYPFTEQHWDSLLQYEGEPQPKPSGEPETVRVGNLDPVTAYYFAIKSRDEEGNESALSNVATGTTKQETQPPGRITDLQVESIGPDAFELTWTAPGDDGIFGRASGYDVRYSTGPIDDPEWDEYPRVTDVPAPKEAGQNEVLVIDGVDGGSTYFFAIKTADEVPNWSQISNVAFVIGGRVDLYLPVERLYAGEELEIFFRAPGTVGVSIRVHRWSVMDECLPAGASQWIYADVINNKMYPEGLHSATFDFRFPDSGELFPSAWYYIVMCWGNTMHQWEGVYFSNNN